MPGSAEHGWSSQGVRQFGSHRSGEADGLSSMSRPRRMPAYPFEPRSNSYLVPGQFWKVALRDGRYGCGRVLQGPRFIARLAENRLVR
jgi:hypothetical protein